MIVGSTKEIAPEKRVSITPDTTKSFKDLGLRVLLQKGYGEELGFKSSEYESNGAEFVNNNIDVVQKSNLICKVNLPVKEELEAFKEKSNLIVGNIKKETANLSNKNYNIFSLS